MPYIKEVETKKDIEQDLDFYQRCIKKSGKKFAIALATGLAFLAVAMPQFKQSIDYNENANQILNDYYNSTEYVSIASSKFNEVGKEYSDGKVSLDNAITTLDNLNNKETILETMKDTTPAKYTEYEEMTDKSSTHSGAGIITSLLSIVATGVSVPYGADLSIYNSLQKNAKNRLEYLKKKEEENPTLDM
ncbi:MAG: hypothetical protein IJA61_02515 [Clostridia bacterium]|nr:hypothetical protein [Clostridia bacterium]